MRAGWTQLPSGRWVTTMDTNYGHLACHAWDGGRWEVTRGQVAIGRGSVFYGGARAAMKAAEAWARQLIETER